MAVVDNSSSGPIFARELSEHLRQIGAPLDKWLRYSIYAQLHEDGGVLTAYQEISDTGFMTALPPDVSEDKMTSLTDTGVQTGQLGSEGTGSLTDWPADTKIRGGEIKGPVQGSVFEAAALRSQLREVTDERDNWEYQAGRMRSDLRRHFGPGTKSVQQAALVLDDVRGELEAARRQRDEASALALRSLELLRMVPTASMSEDVEVMHHALVADPRTSGTEAVLAGFLSATVDRRAGELVRDRLAEYDDDQRTALESLRRRAGDAEARVIELESRLSYQRARGWCEMGLVMLLGLAFIGWMS